MIAEPLVEAGDDGQLDGDLQVDGAGGVALEDLCDELAVHVVEAGVHVGEGRRSHAVDGEVRLGRLLVLLLRLIAHLLDHAAQLRIEVVTVDPARRLADVAAQVGRALDLGEPA